jgi:hypothetical protein
MSTRLSTPLVLTAAVVLIGATAGAAAADPPSLNADECAATLGAAGLWPGAIDDGDHQIRLVSDGYDNYVSRQPVCTPDPTDR